MAAFDCHPATRTQLIGQALTIADLLEGDYGYEYSAEERLRKELIFSEPFECISCRSIIRQADF